MTTFAELGIPFPLYEGKVEQTNYAGLGICSLCGVSDRHCFHLGVGDFLIEPCPKCSALTGLDAADCLGGTCLYCQTILPFPLLHSYTDEGTIRVCHSCLRAGRVAMNRDTEYGPLQWEDAVQGHLGGWLHSWKRNGDDVWCSIRLSAGDLWTLLQTPLYDSNQGALWQFCGTTPMTYVGQWMQEDFHQHAPNGDGKAFYQRLVYDKNAPWDCVGENTICVYVFRCSKCGGYKVHWDMD